MTRLIGTAVVVLACVGCASGQLPTLEEEVTVWLTEQPRVLAVKVDAEVPKPQVLVRDYKPAQRLGHGALGAARGAGTSILGGCAFGGLFGCAAGLMLAPVLAVTGAVAGAASVDSVDVPHELDRARGAPELYQRAGSGETLQALFSRALIAASDKSWVDGARLAPHADSGATLTLSFVSFDLLGELGDDPSVSVALTARAEVTIPEGSTLTYPDFIYEGASRRMSAWRAEEDRLFREELAAAAQSIAERTVQRLRSAMPAAGAVQKVARLREQRRQASLPVPEPPPEPPLAAPAALSAGMAWTYAFEDQLFAHRRHRFTVQARAVEDGVVVEALQGDNAHATEAIAIRPLAFIGRRILPGDPMLELSPYLVDGASLSETPSGYPLGPSPEPWRLSTNRVVVEQVSVPAGTFNALRVEVRGERPAVPGMTWAMWNTAGATRFRYTAWYAPEVGRYVMARHEQWSLSGSPIADERVQLVGYRAP